MLDRICPQCQQLSSSWTHSYSSFIIPKLSSLCFKIVCKIFCNTNLSSFDVWNNISDITLGTINPLLRRIYSVGICDFLLSLRYLSISRTPNYWKTILTIFFIDSPSRYSILYYLNLSSTSPHDILETKPYGVYKGIPLSLVIHLKVFYEQHLMAYCWCLSSL